MPGPMPADCPLPEVRPGVRMHGRWVTPLVTGTRLPDGRRLDVQGPVPDGPSELEGFLPGTETPLREVLYLEEQHWVTERGRLPDRGSRVGLAKKHPHLISAGRRYVNFSRVRRLGETRILLDEGTELDVSANGAQALRRRLGLPSLVDLRPADPRHRLLFALGFRDWPDGAALGAADPVARIARLLDEESRRSAPAHSADEFLEQKVRPALPELTPVAMGNGTAPPDVMRRRSSAIADREVLILGAEAALQRFRRFGVPDTVLDPALYLFRVVLHALAAQLGLVSCRDLGWESGSFHRGSDVLVLADSSVVEPALEALRREHGVSTARLDGAPPAALVEQVLGSRPGRVVGHFDFTPRGHALVEAFCRLLQARGLEVELAGHLVNPGRFTPTELRGLSFRESAEEYDDLQRRRAWRRRNGAAPSVLAAHLSPVRACRALEEELHRRPPVAPADEPLRRPGVLLLQDSKSLRMARMEEVLSLEPEAWDRIQATLRDGSVAWRPGPVDPSLQEWQVDTGVVPEIGVRSDEVLGLREGAACGIWVTDRGEVPARGRARANLALHPHLAPFGAVWTNLRRISRILGSEQIELDTGEVRRFSHHLPPALLPALGLASLLELPRTTAPQRAMLRQGLRDWPAPLFPNIPPELTQAGGGTARLLLANLLWRTVRSNRNGPELHYGRTHRNFLYHPALPALALAGFRGQPVRLLEEGQAEWRAWFTSQQEAEEDPHWHLLLDLARELVGEDRLCDYESLGFRDSGARYRVLGGSRREVVVLVEKQGFDAAATALHEEFGVTTYRAGGTPRLIATEFLAKDLLRCGVSKVEIVAYVDWDPKGHQGAQTLVEHLERFGLEVPNPVRYLVTPDRFTEDELRLLSFPLESVDANIRTLIRKWVARTGGIHGKARGIHADHLQPLERVLKAFREVAPT